ncbi:MAG TPA: MoaD/ThiS family protein [Dehalococcoidia bacterium]|nr:MoaD/ThiS family protein [Dehalococcoidia bacterium]
MVEVYLPDSLARLFEGRPRKVEIEAGTIGELMWRLNTNWPGIRDRLCSSDGAIRRHINVYVDGERSGPDTVLRQGAVVQIIPAVSGG